MANLDDPNAVDITSDLQDETVVSNTEVNGGTRQAGTDDEPQDIRSLLTKAVTGELSTDEAGRVRDAAGKFASKTPAEQAAETNAPAPPANTDQPQEYKPNLEEAELAAINSMPEAHRPALLKALQVREAAFSNINAVAQELFNRNRGYESIEQIIGPRRQQLALQGASVEGWLNQVSTLSDFADKQPAEFIQWYAGQRGIDLKQLSEDFIPPDPHIQALQTELAQLKGAMGQTHNFQQGQVLASMADQVSQFADARDANGNPARPYFNEVQNDLLHMLPVLKQQNPGAHPQALLQAAYDQAIWANPGTRTKLIQLQEAQRTQDAAERAARARNAGSSVSGGPMNGTTAAPPMNAESVRGALEAAIAQHGG